MPAAVAIWQWLNDATISERAKGWPVNETGKIDTGGSAKAPSRWRLAPLAVIAAGFVLFFALGGNEYLSFSALKEHREALLAWREGNEIAAVLIFTALYAVIVALSLPGAVWMTIAGGFLFGTILATFCTVTGATVGATVIFLAARYALADYLRDKAGRAIRKMEAGFRENALSYLLFLRLIPAFPFWLVNLVPAFLGVPLGTYVIGTFIGIIPGSFVYASVGNGVGAVIDAGGTPDLSIIFAPEILVPIVGLAALALLPVGYKRFKGKPADRRPAG